MVQCAKAIEDILCKQTGEVMEDGGWSSQEVSAKDETEVKGSVYMSAI